MYARGAASGGPSFGHEVQDIAEEWEMLKVKALTSASTSVGDALNELEADVMRRLPEFEGVALRQAMSVIERIREEKPKLSDGLGRIIREAQALYSQVKVQ